jgi:hypothetical protein
MVLTVKHIYFSTDGVTEIIHKAQFCGKPEYVAAEFCSFWDNLKLAEGARRT